jgi:flagellar basal-body rod protein FlgG
MLRSLNSAASGMIAQQTNMDTIANNLANVNTTGFKAQRAEFQDIVYQTLRASGAQGSNGTTTPSPVQIGLGTRFSTNLQEMTQGAMLSTGNPLDIAIQGDGFFKIEMPDGTDAYTRDGSFKPDANGNIVTTDGYKLVPNITITPGTAALSVSPTGAVSGTKPGDSTPTEFGTITLTRFTNPAGLTRLGQNLYQAGGASGEAEDVAPGTNNVGTLGSGFLEGSNVQIVEEMVRMITAQRSYEINSKAITTSDQMLQTVNQLKS